MRVRRIDYDDEEMPETVTVEMSLEEMGSIYSVMGNITDTDLRERYGVTWQTSHGICNAITSVLNRHYDDGWRGWRASR